MSDQPLEEVIGERAFAETIGGQAEMFHRLAHTLVRRRDPWTRQQFFQLISEADALEALLDDHGARHNRTFSYLRELVASLRGLAFAGFSVAHLERRLDSYGAVLAAGEADVVAESVRHTRGFLEGALGRVLTATLEEEVARGVVVAAEAYPESRNGTPAPRRRLPRNMGQEDLDDDEQKVAELASKFLQVCAALEELGVRRIDDVDARETWLQRFCSEEKARVLEATVHNLQSAYDTWVKNTTLEAQDPRLPRLRGHASAALHLLEGVTHLTHFVERHESGTRHEENERRIEALVRRREVRDVTLNHLLFWASVFVRRGRKLAEDLVPTYTDVRELVLTLPEDVTLHARPCALIVGIVNHHATPVQMLVDGRACNAGSILDLMVAVGSHPDALKFAFRGDVKPLRDIELLFRAGLGERGIDALPDELAYLRSGS